MRQVRRIRRPTARPPSHPSPIPGGHQRRRRDHRNGKDADCFFDLAQTESPERKILSVCQKARGSNPFVRTVEEPPGRLPPT